MIDILIIGAGAAGLSAAVTAKARNKDVLVIGNALETSAIFKAERVDNYLGMYGISGASIIESYRKHADDMGVAITTGKVQQLLSMGDYFSINAGDNFYEAKTIILATGIKWGGQIKGESEFVGKGLSYCATCDGMLYRGKKVVTIGDNEETEHDVKFLSEICGSVTHLKGKVTEICGAEKVSSVVYNGGTIECDGVFIIEESIPATALIYGIEMDGATIKTDKQMKTNLPGVFAAGDITGKPYQIAKAVGEGLVAALSAVAYIGSL